MKAKNAKLLLSIIVLATGQAAAQTTISSTARYAWSANSGWIDFRPSAADGVRFYETYLAGKAWAANSGWLDFGTGSPANGHTWQNNSAADHGVNLSPEGHLTGYAWSANTGWVTFEQTHGRPRLSYLTGRISGHAWSGNLGWIAFDTGFSDLITTQIHYPDSDGDGMGDHWEQLHFHNLTTASAGSDTDKDGHPDHSEYAAGTDPLNPCLSCASRITVMHPTRLQRPWNSPRSQTGSTRSSIPPTFSRGPTTIPATSSLPPLPAI